MRRPDRRVRQPGAESTATHDRAPGRYRLDLAGEKGAEPASGEPPRTLHQNEGQVRHRGECQPTQR